VRGSLLDSALYHGPARAYCVRSPAWELAEDSVPRLVLFLVCQQALLVYRFPSDIYSCAGTLLFFTRIRVIIAAEIRIATLTSIQTTSVGAASCAPSPVDLNLNGGFESDGAGWAFYEYGNLGMTNMSEILDRLFICVRSLS
jgi:hypothetical protein